MDYMEYKRVNNAEIAIWEGKAKIRFYIDGQKYALRLTKKDFDRLAVPDGTEIPVVTLKENSNV